MIKAGYTLCNMLPSGSEWFSFDLLEQHVALNTTLFKHCTTAILPDCPVLSVFPPETNCSRVEVIMSSNN